MFYAKTLAFRAAANDGLQNPLSLMSAPTSINYRFYGGKG